MITEQMYVLISIVVLAMVSLLLIQTYKDTKKKRLSKLASIAFFFIIAGIIFGENQLIGYSLMGVGVILAVVDIIKKSVKKESRRKHK